MKRLDSLMQFITGSAQFRIKESIDRNDPLYLYYGQSELENDLMGLPGNSSDGKQIRTPDKVTTVEEGDVLFSLISGRAAPVRACHEGYVFTQNYVKIIPDGHLDHQYLVYLLNEDLSMKEQLQRGLQGSAVLKYTVKQLKELLIPKIPALKIQRLIGGLYLNQMHLQAIQERAARLETLLVLGKLKEAAKDE